MALNTQTKQGSFWTDTRARVFVGKVREHQFINYALHQKMELILWSLTRVLVKKVSFLYLRVLVAKLSILWKSL